MAMPPLTSKVEQDGSREGLQAALDSGAGGGVSATSVPQKDAKTHACEIETSGRGDEDAPNGDTTLNTTSGHEATKIASDTEAATQLSSISGATQQNPIEHAAPSQDGDIKDEPKNGRERDDDPHEEQSEPPSLPVGSRGPKEPLADYV